MLMGFVFGSTIPIHVKMLEVLLPVFGPGLDTHLFELGSYHYYPTWKHTQV
jgi:hypothetical protein